MVLSKADLKKLPKVVGDEAERQMEYVQSVLGGKEKKYALVEFFPEMYEKALSEANGNKEKLVVNIRRQIHKLEAKNVVKKMYEVAHKSAWTNFVVKKHRLYENLYDMAMDDLNSVRDRATCSKTLLDHMPKFEEDKTIVIEHKDGKAEFLEGLRKMQIDLHKQANKSIGDVIDVEVDDD